MNGILIALLELFIFYSISLSSRKLIKNFKNIEVISYYWLSFTILTGIWEICFIINYHHINKLSLQLINNKQHVWTNSYSIDYILPWKLANIFYAEYGAWADREYMIDYNYWSRLIEGSHSGFCGLFSLLGMIYRLEYINKKYLVCIVLSMGTQLMNSILYIGQYLIQINDKNNVNYLHNNFPAGFLLIKRYFMYINIFWTIMPSYVLYKTLTNKNEVINNPINNKNKNNTITQQKPNNIFKIQLLDPNINEV